MKIAQGISFIEGLVFGGLVGVGTALLLAPASGKETRAEIRFESNALRHRGQVYRDDKQRQVKKVIKQRQKEVAQAQARLSEAIGEGKESLREAMGVSK